MQPPHRPPPQMIMQDCGCLRLPDQFSRRPFTSARYLVIIVIIAAVIVIIITVIANESREPWGTAMAFQIAVRGQIMPRFMVACACRPSSGLLRCATRQRGVAHHPRGRRRATVGCQDCVELRAGGFECHRPRRRNGSLISVRHCDFFLFCFCFPFDSECV